MDLGTLIPDLATGAAAGAAGLALALVAGSGAAALRRRGVRVAYTRKLFHFGIFTGAGAVHAWAGLAATNAYGATVAALVLVAVLRGEGDAFYEALARETDRPHRSLFIVVPLLTTAVGGLLSGLLAGPWAAVGYVVAGWGDAVGEPVGARWGRHPYRVPSLAGVPAIRTWEGSSAVLVAGWGAAVLVAAGLGVPPAVALLPSLGVAVGATAVEALSPHGTDNLTVQVTASALSVLLLA
ncbi:MAG: hypothetical protein AMXMBFR53_43560 [Gemmatimonadota bacterium]